MINKTKLAIIGGSYLQAPVVKRAKEMGIETHCFAWAKGAVCKDIADYFYPISIVEKEKILEKCQEVGINGILTIASDVAVPTVNYVAERMGLVGNSDKDSLSMTNKFMMRERFTKYGVPSPKYARIKESDVVVPNLFTFPVIVKPTDRSGSLGVEKVKEESQLPHAIKRACENSFGREAIVEEFIDGREISVECISYKGTHYILQITDKVTTGEPYFVELEHHQPSSLPEDVKEKVKDIVLNALTALNIQYGASHSELKITPIGDIKIIEIGARMGGDFIGSDLVRLSTGYDFLEGVIQVSLGIFEIPKLTENKYSGVYFLSAETPRIKDYIENATFHPEIVKSEITDSELHHIKESADRSGYFIYQSEKRIELKTNEL